MPNTVAQQETTAAATTTMPPCAPTQYRPTIGDHPQPQSRRVIFPTLYKKAPAVAVVNEESTGEGSSDPELKMDTIARVEGKTPPAVAAVVKKKKKEEHQQAPVKALHRPPLNALEIPEGATPPRTSILHNMVGLPNTACSRRSILSRYQLPVPVNFFPLPSSSSSNEEAHPQAVSTPPPPARELVSILRHRSFGGGSPNSSSPASTTTTDTSTSTPTSKNPCASSVPSLESLHESEDSQSSLETAASSSSKTKTKIPRPNNVIRRSSSEPGKRTSPSSQQHRMSRIHFDPRIWIREFERSPEEQDCTWYNDEDMERFKRHALALIMARDHLLQTQASQQIMSTGTTRTILTTTTPSSSSSFTRGVAGRAKAAAFYTHAALTLDGEKPSSSTNNSSSNDDDDDDVDHRHLLSQALQKDPYRTVVAQQEIRRILLVDPHDICITLFRKAFTTLLPKVEIVAASNATQALELIAGATAAAARSSNSKQAPFDILVVEERLQPLFHDKNRQDNKNNDKTASLSSGSNLFMSLASISRNHSHQRPSQKENNKTTDTTNNKKSAALWIGVSAHLNKDLPSLEAAGADLCWGKPPPKMSNDLRNQLLKALLLKRGQMEMVQELFGDAGNDNSNNNNKTTDATTTSIFL